MLNSVAAGRRLAQRTLAWQVVAAVLVALAFLPKGMPEALAALAGGLALLLGNWLSARIALGGGVAPAAAALGRLLAGVLVKWLVVAVVLALALGVFRWPALPVLAGVAAAVLANVLAHTVQRQV